MKTGLVIKKLRTEHGLTQEELANSLFVSRELVSKWETGLRLPDIKNIEKIAELFGVGTDIITDPNDMILKELSSSVPPDFPAEVFPDALNRFLDTISRKECAVFVRRIYYFESTAEIAVRLELKEGTVRSLLSRTGNKLKKFLSEGLK